MDNPPKPTFARGTETWLQRLVLTAFIIFCMTMFGVSRWGAEVSDAYEAPRPIQIPYRAYTIKLLYPDNSGHQYTAATYEITNNTGEGQLLRFTPEGGTALVYSGPFLIRGQR